MFAAFTPDLNELAHWLQKFGVQIVAMSPQGFTGFDCCQILEIRGPEVYLALLVY
jgi:hypothetical protein